MADHLPGDAPEGPFRPQRHRQRGIHQCLGAADQLHPARGHVQQGAAGNATVGLDAPARTAERCGAGGAIEGLRLDLRCGRAGAGLRVAQVGELQRRRRHPFTDIHPRRATFGDIPVVDGGKAFFEPQVHHRRGEAGANLERQFAFACDAGGRFDVGHLEIVPADVDPVFDLDALERGRRKLQFLLEGEVELAGRLAQPAQAHVVEHDVPLVPQAGRILQLDAADHAEMDALVDALAADAQQRRVVHQRRHLADGLDVRVVAQERGGAVVADGEHRSCRLELHRCAAGRAGGDLHGP